MAEVRKLHQKDYQRKMLLLTDIKSLQSQDLHIHLDSYLLQYINAVGRTDYIKVEINYSNRVHVLTPKQYKVSSKVVEDITLLALDGN